MSAGLAYLVDNLKRNVRTASFDMIVPTTLVTKLIAAAELADTDDALATATAGLTTNPPGHYAEARAAWLDAAAAHAAALAAYRTARSAR